MLANTFRDPGLIDYAVALAIWALMLAAWRALARHMRPLAPGDTSTDGFLLFVVGYAITFVTTAVLLAGSEPTLLRLLLLQSLSALLAVGVVLVLAARRHVPLRALGLARRPGPSALVVAAVAWLAFLPVFAGVAWLQGRLLGGEDDMQRTLRLFVEDEGARGAALNWLLMVLVLPATEELFFRGALYGGLRRLLHPVAAIAGGAIVFGLAHGTVALLPATALGAVLCVIYERTGSLAAPFAFHALHNGATLAIVSLVPDLA